MNDQQLKPWSYVKTQVHDISGLIGHPNSYIYKRIKGVWYPALRML
jgi:hypothetical protein